MNSLLFSIIIPTYNSGKTLLACLESIFNQSFRNFEVIIVDGVSIDNTSFIVKTFKEINSSIHWVSEKDNGIYDAMNKGVKMAKGEWVYFLGSDDTLFDKDVLLKIKNKISEHGKAHVLYGNVINKFHNNVFDGEYNMDKLLIQNICQQAIFIKRLIFAQIGFFNQKYKTCADWDHNMRWFFSEKIVKIYIDIIIANYAAGGFSTFHPDIIFNSEKRIKYVIYGYRTLPFSYKFMVFKNELLKYIKSRNLAKSLEIIFYLPYIFIPFRKN